MELKCNCGYSWDYDGGMTMYASCPNCRRHVKIKAEASKPKKAESPDT